MSEPNDIPNYIKCSCRHCNGHIKIDANQLRPGETRQVECPHCHLETTVFLPLDDSKKDQPLKIQKSSKIELFLFELTRYPTVFLALLVLAALISTAYLTLRTQIPQKPLPPPVISYASVMPPETITSRYESASVPSEPKMAAKKAFPQPVTDFLLNHVGFSLKEWLDQVKPTEREAFLANLAAILQTANNKSLSDTQLKEVVKNYAELWLASVKEQAELQIKIDGEKQRHFEVLVCVGFGLLMTLMVLCLILVLLAIERNTRLLLKNS
ncbi:MAG TPA: hypothetical protein VK815_07030 [Candidatus Acidoferrales bacterium]|jgi:hypothetical protein|nr:hypothetical protein [Candidatus Acidoferrales bacterium]